MRTKAPSRLGYSQTAGGEAEPAKAKRADNKKKLRKKSIEKRGRKEGQAWRGYKTIKTRT
jgi:hypothetical protein